MDNNEILSKISSEIKIRRPEESDENINTLSEKVLNIFNNISDTAMKTEDITKEVIDLCIKLSLKSDVLSKSFNNLVSTYDHVIDSVDKLSNKFSTKMNNMNSLDISSEKLFKSSSENISKSANNILTLPRKIDKSINTSADMILKPFRMISSILKDPFKYFKTSINNMFSSLASKLDDFLPISLSKSKREDKRTKLLAAGIVDISLNENEVLRKSAPGIAALWLYKKMSHNIVGESSDLPSFSGDITTAAIGSQIGRSFLLFIPKAASMFGRLAAGGLATYLSYKIGTDRLATFRESGKSVESVLGLERGTASKTQKLLTQGSIIAAGDTGAGTIKERAINSAKNLGIGGAVGGGIGAFFGGVPGAFFGAKLGMAAGASLGWAGGEELARALNTTGELLKAFGANTIKTMSELPEISKNLMIGFISKVKTGKDKFLEILSDIKDVSIEKFNALKDIVGPKMVAIGTVLGEKFGEIKTAVSPYMISIKDTIVSGFNVIKDNLFPIIIEINNIVLKGFSKIKDELSPIFDQMSVFFKEKLNIISEYVKENIIKVPDKDRPQGILGVEIGENISKSIGLGTRFASIEMDKLSENIRLNRQTEQNIINNSKLVSDTLLLGSNVVADELVKNSDDINKNSGIIRSLITSLEKFSVAIGIGSFTQNYTRNNPTRVGYTDNNLVDRTLALIMSQEAGAGYSAVNPNDLGTGASLGILQWNRGRAQRLLRKMYSADEETFTNIMGEDIVKSLSDKNWARPFSRQDITNWQELNKLEKMQHIQLETAREVVSGYINYAKQKFGMTDPLALMAFSDLRNQMGNSADKYGNYNNFDQILEASRNAKYRASRNARVFDILSRSDPDFYDKAYDKLGIKETTINITKTTEPNIIRDVKEAANIGLKPAEASEKPNITSQKDLNSFNKDFIKTVNEKLTALVDQMKESNENRVGGANTEPVGPSEEIPGSILQYIFGVNSSGTDCKISKFGGL